MSDATLTNEQIESTRKMTVEQRLNYFLNQVREKGEIWILTDEHGAVMLTTEDEDCIPVWPSAEFAELWATGEWQGFEPKAITLKHWLNKWTMGLEDDEIAVVVFPVSEDDGLVLDAVELAYELEKKN